jgi:hypothetical protein
MLGADFGGLRPWEIRDLTPSETQQLITMRNEILRAREEV